MKQITVIVSDDRNSITQPLAHNGRIQFLPVGAPAVLDEEMFDALSNSSIAFEVVGEGDGSEGGVLAEPSPPKSKRKAAAKKKGS